MSGKKAFILGYTGEVGKELVKAVFQDKNFQQITLIGRRMINYENDLKSLEQKAIDFDQIENYSDVFRGFDVGFCCLGTTRAQAGAEGFYKVDHDYVVKSAKLAKDGGCEEFHLVSSGGANKDSFFLYPKTKGQTEDDVTKIGFKYLYIYRPSVLLCDREESRLAEKTFKTLIKPVTWAFPTFISIPTSTVALGIVIKATQPKPNALDISGEKNHVEIIDNKELHILGSKQMN
ncbi:hypothetical protein HELRODRAFT_66168 [Helobdella robusta]|uniref:Protein HTATIP2 n=1 Tax=Helobdella robusta TaxID=6412 RepID=T1FYH9_HELRO|nr:hypothetical protein HELRODRAFT_66168 [Helobdella robusta]ESO02200.1 hypothetical protein HELRODRAFT_66168 [Helobdella robusta]